MAAAEKGKKKRAPLSSFTILLIILVVLAIVTVIMSACGVEGVQGATLSQVLTAPVFGFQDAIGVCLFVMILGGFLGIVTETGALDAGIAALVHKLKGNELVLIPILMFIFSIGGTTYGMCEETVPFYLLLAATMVAAGFDSLTGAAVVLLGAGCGVLGSTVNPFAVGVAVDALSGVGIAVNQAIIIALGAILWLVTITISIIFVMRYAKKVKADKGSTFLSLQEQQDMMNEWGMKESEVEAGDGQTAAPAKMTGRREYVNALAKEYAADGIIYEQIKFCDPWAYERMMGSHILHDDYGYPVLSVDRPYNISTSGQMRTRVQAFVESIEIKKIQGGDK